MKRMIDEVKDLPEADLMLPTLRQKCPYLDTINRQYLDFDNQKICSVTLTNLNIYCCLVCGKFFQGRGKQTPAYTHSVQMNHYCFMNLNDTKVYCLPDNYEIIDASLNDIKKCLSPQFSSSDIENLFQNTSLAKDMYDVAYLPGCIGLNNLKATDYMNVIFHLLAHISPIRDFFMDSNNYKNAKSSFIKSFGLLIRKLWSHYNFKNVISPFEVVHEIDILSKKKYSIENRVDCSEFLMWMLQELNKGVSEISSKKGKTFLKCLRGKIEVTSTTYSKSNDKSIEKDSNQNNMQIETTEVKTSPFLFLSLEIPPCPLFRDSQGGLIIPQIPIFELLKKFDGTTSTDQVSTTHMIRKQYKITKLPKYLIFQLKRFNMNNFTLEKNPTIVTFPVKNFEMKDYLFSNYNNSDISKLPSLEMIHSMSVEDIKLIYSEIKEYVSEGINFDTPMEQIRQNFSEIISDIRESMFTKYDLVANICHDSLISQSVTVGNASSSFGQSKKNKDVTNNITNNSIQSGMFRVHLQHRATSQWYELKDLHVVETIPQLVGISESCLLVYEKKTTNTL